MLNGGFRMAVQPLGVVDADELGAEDGAGLADFVRRGTGSGHHGSLVRGT